MIPYIDTHDFDRYFCALCVTYKPDSLEIDLEAYRRLVRYFTTDERWIEHGGALIANPEAGEIFYMTPEERAATIKVVLEERPKGMPVFAGAYGIRRDEVLASAVQAKELGVDGIFVMPPTGTMEVSTSLDGAKNPEIWTDHVRAIAEATELPLILHPSHPRNPQWGGALPIESVKMVVETVPSVVGWKMIYMNAPAHFRVARYLRSLPRHVALLNAPHFCYHTCLIQGLVDGAVQGAYNFNKEGMVEHTLAWRDRDMARVKKIFNEQVMPVHEFIYEDFSRLHVRYKIAAWIRGLVSHPFMRQPMPPPRREEAERCYEVLKKTGQSIVGREEFEMTFARQKEILGKGY